MIMEILNNLFLNELKFTWIIICLVDKKHPGAEKECFWKEIFNFGVWLGTMSKAELIFCRPRKYEVFNIILSGNLPDVAINCKMEVVSVYMLTEKMKGIKTCVNWKTAFWIVKSVNRTICKVSLGGRLIWSNV